MINSWNKKEILDFKKFNNLELNYNSIKNPHPNIYLYNNNISLIDRINQKELDKGYISEIKDINEPVVIFLSRFVNSFGHFLNEIYKMFYIYLNNYSNLKILIFNIENKKHYYNQIISLLIPKEKIIILKEDILYKIKEGYYLEETNDKRSLNYTSDNIKVINYVKANLISKTKNIKIDKYDIIINCNRESAIFEPYRTFTNYKDFIEKLKLEKINCYYLNPNNINLVEQIYLLNNCKLFICDYGSAINNLYFMKNKAKLITISHPFVSWKNMKENNYFKIAKYFNINFKYYYCDIFINKKKLNKINYAREKIVIDDYSSEHDKNKNFEVFLPINKIIEEINLNLYI